MATVIERVDRLEATLADFATSVAIEFNKLAVGDEIIEVKNRAGFEPRRW